MEYKQGQINEIIGTALHLAGKVAGKVAAGAIKGGKKGKASYKVQTQKAKNFDANKAIVNASDRAERKLNRKSEPLSKAKKQSNATNSKLADIKATRKAAGQVSKSEGKSEELKSIKKSKKKTIKTLRQGAKDADKLGKATTVAKDSAAALKSRVDEDTFTVTFISEGHKKTERQYKKAHKDKDMGRMVKLAKKHKKQKDKSLDRKALRDVMKHSEGDVNEGSGGITKMSRKLAAEVKKGKREKGKKGKSTKGTEKKLSIKSTDSIKRRLKVNVHDKHRKAKDGFKRDDRRDSQYMKSKKVTSSIGNKDKSERANSRNRPTG